MSITEHASQYYIGQEENEGDGFPDKQGGKYNGVYFLRDESGNLIYTGTDHDKWYDFAQEYRSQKEADSEESTDEEVVDEEHAEEESMDEEVVDEEHAEEESMDEEESTDEEIVDEEYAEEESTDEEVVDKEESTDEEVVDEDLEDTTVYSPSNAGEPIENPDIQADTNDGNDLNKLDFSSQYSSPNGSGNDTYSGTGGVNTYEFNPLLNAKPEIIDKHTNGNGRIDWQGVAGENDNYHDHWVDSLGNDTIMDFSGQGGDGDKINVTGHTTVVTDVIEESDGQVVLGVYSDQGADGSRGDGAHDLDILGTITVNHDGNFNFGNDVNVNANGVFDGVREFA